MISKNTKFPLDLEAYSFSSTSKQWPQYLAVLSVTFLAVGSGLQNGWPAPSVPKMLSDDFYLDITEDEISYILMVGPLGNLLGSPLSGYLLDRIGRKYTLLILSLPQLFNWILLITSNHVSHLYMCRFFSGVGDGALFAALPVYVCEIAETKIRGTAGSSLTIGIVIGLLMINLYGSYVSIEIAAWISLCFPLIFIVSFLFMPESPYYLLMKKRNDDARKSLKKLRWMNNVEAELSQLVKDVERQQSESGRFIDIFLINSNFKAFATLMILRTIQQFSGTIVLNYYSQVIFQQAQGPLSAKESSILCTIVECLTGIFGCFLFDKFGRKPIYAISTIGSTFLLLFVGLYFQFQLLEYNVSLFSWVPIVGLVLFSVIGTIGMLMVPNLMGGEVLSTSVKTKVMAILNIYLGLCLSGALKVFQSLENAFGLQAPFYVFAIVSLLGFSFCYWYLIETRGKTLEEIQQILKNNKSSLK